MSDGSVAVHVSVPATGRRPGCVNVLVVILGAVVVVRVAHHLVGVQVLVR